MSETPNMANRRLFAAKIISHVASPTFLAIPTFVLLLIVTNPTSLPILLFVALLFGSILPLAIIFALYKMGKIGDMEVSERSKRWMPFLGAIASYAFGSWLLLVLVAPSIVTALMFCYFGNTIITAIISLRWKISVHAVGVSGPITVLFYSLGCLYSLWLLLIIPVGWSRVELKAHTWAQIVVGFLLSIATTWIQLYLLLYIFLL
ncbi:MAG: PAP2 family protein [Promethearchaeota archaeon]